MLLAGHDPYEGQLILKYKLKGISSSDFTLKLFNDTYNRVFDINLIKKMYVDGKSVTPSHTYNCGSINIDANTPKIYTVICHMKPLSGEDLISMFHYIDYLYEVDFTHLDLSNITSINNLFANAHVSNINMKNCDLNSVTDTTRAFYSTHGGVYAGDNLKINLSGCGFKNVTKASGMFNNSRFKSIGRGTNYDVNITGCLFQNATDISSMFQNCTQLVIANLSGYVNSSGKKVYNFTKASNMQYMFYGCNRLTTVDFTACDLINVGPGWGMWYMAFATDYYDGNSQLSKIYYSDGLNSSLPNEEDDDVFATNECDHPNGNIYFISSSARTKFSSCVAPPWWGSSTYTISASKYTETEAYPHALP